jgi:hypothetical protein
MLHGTSFFSTNLLQVPSVQGTSLGSTEERGDTLGRTAGRSRSELPCGLEMKSWSIILRKLRPIEPPCCLKDSVARCLRSRTARKDVRKRFSGPIGMGSEMLPFGHV